ncbi:MAG TPA: hypothetical protein VLB79_04210 [Solirubrobacterales bacterium]|nr:hypothetical protein [Solirubrobacterales bacterium]
MQSRAARLGLLAAVIVAAVVLFIVLRNDNGGDGGGGVTTTTSAGGVTTVVDPVQVVNVDASGNPVGGERTLTYNKGEQVRLRVNLAKPEDAVHVHGYELEKPAEQSPVTFSFPARLDGIFEIEVHRLDHTGGPIATLRVNP